MRFRPALQQLEQRENPSGFAPEFDPPPTFGGPGSTPGETSTGDPTWGSGYTPPPSGGDLGMG